LLGVRQVATRLGAHNDAPSRNSGTGAITEEAATYKCSTCSGLIVGWFKMCPTCGTHVKKAALGEAPEQPEFYKAESVASGTMSVASQMSTADKLRAGRRLEKAQQQATQSAADRYMRMLQGLWMDQHMASAGARFDAFVNGTVAEQAQGVATARAKERLSTVAALRTDMLPPDHLLNWEVGLTGRDTANVGSIKQPPPVAPSGPLQAVVELTDKMVAVIDRAEAASSGYHGPSHRLAMEAVSPRSEAATTHVDEGPPTDEALARPKTEVLAILAQMHLWDVTAVPIDSLTTDEEALEARCEALEDIIVSEELADPNSKSWPLEAIAAAQEALRRKHSWAASEPATDAGRQWRCTECAVTCNVPAGHEGPPFGCGPRWAQPTVPTPLGSAWVMLADSPDQQPKIVPDQATEGLEGTMAGPAVSDGNGPSHEEPPVAQPASQDLHPPLLPMRERILASPLLALGANRDPPDLSEAPVTSPTHSLQECWPPTAASLSSMPPSVGGTPPVASSSSLGKEWGVIRP